MPAKWPGKSQRPTACPRHPRSRRRHAPPPMIAHNTRRQLIKQPPHAGAQQAGSGALSLCDVAGRRLRSLRDGPLPAGALRVDWDGRDDAGRALASGVYFAQTTAVDPLNGHNEKAKIKIMNIQ